MNDFDCMAERFTARVREAADWKPNYLGAAYATRIKAAIANLREAIAEAERNPEIAKPGITNSLGCDRDGAGPSA